MRCRLALTLLVAACSAASDDPVASTTDEPTSAGSNTTAPGSESGSGTTGESTGGNSSGQSSGGDSSSTAADSTTLPEVCEIADASPFADVEGCPVPIGEPSCSEGQEHVPQDSAIEWLSDPPHSGPHYPTWETWGEHEDWVPRGNWVHNLEHGGIVLAYRCNDDCPDELAVLREVVAMRPDLRILLTQDPLLGGEPRFAAIAWTWIHRFDAPDLAELLCFADQHENFAPEDVP